MITRERKAREAERRAREAAEKRALEERARADQERQRADEKDVKIAEAAEERRRLLARIEELEARQNGSEESAPETT